MKKIFFTILILLLAFYGYSLFEKRDSKKELEKSRKITENRLLNHVDEVKKLINKSDDYNSKLAFFIDMKVKSGKNRFFVYDLKKGKITDKGLVAHGSGSETGIDGKLKFSNVNNSLCTSLGKYAIGNSYNGQFGKAYKLDGLDTTNDNAFLRNIVLHKYSKVPYEEQKNTICNSYGCPMVNEIFYKRIEKIIDNSRKKYFYAFIIREVIMLTRNGA